MYTVAKEAIFFRPETSIWTVSTVLVYGVHTLCMQLDVTQTYIRTYGHHCTPIHTLKVAIKMCHNGRLIDNIREPSLDHI